MERLTLAIIMATCLLVNASSSSSIASSSTLPFSPSSYGELRSIHESNNVCSITQRQQQSNATIEQPYSVENSNSATSHVIHTLYNALNNFLLVRSAIVATKDLTSSPSASATHGSTTSSPYKVGSIVELYKEESYFATPAIVTSSSSSSSIENTVVVQNTITNTYSTISTSYIHAYTTYDNGTRASCNVSAPNSNEAYMKPCVVNSHTLRPNSGLVLYEVSYLNEEDELVKEMLPFSRVQRRRQPVISQTV